MNLFVDALALGGAWYLDDYEDGRGFYCFWFPEKIIIWLAVLKLERNGFSSRKTRAEMAFKNPEK